MKRNRVLPLAMLGLGIWLTGCSANKAVPARLSGKVSYNGQAVKAGSLRFHTPEGTVYEGQISTDGTYTATDLPEGELVVTLETESLNPNKKKDPAMAANKDTDRRMKSMQAYQAPPPGAETPQQHYIKVPEKYGNPRTSPVSITASRGRQTHDLEFPP